MKKKLAALILTLLAVIFGVELSLVVTLSSYTQLDITADQLYGEEQENLKDFELADDGTLTAVGNDPWIVYEFPNEMAVHSVTIYLSDVQTEDSITQCFLMPGYECETADLQSGAITLSFSGQESGEISSIRLDLTAHEGDSMKVEKVVVNSRSLIAGETARMLPLVVCLAAMLVAEVWLWMAIFQQQRDASESGKLRPWPLWGAIVQAVAKVVVLVALSSNLLITENGGHNVVLSWVAVLGLESACLCALSVRRWQKHDTIWGQLLVLPFWAVAVFGISELMNIANFSFQSVKYLALNLMLYCVPALVIALLAWRVAISIPITSVLFTIWAIANHFYGQFRSNPLEYSDIMQAGTAMNVIGNYTLTIDNECIAVIAITVAVSMCVISAFGMNHWKWNKVTLPSGIGTGVALIAVVCVMMPAYGTGQAWDISSVTERNGYMASFVAYTVAGLKSDKPDGYSVDYVNEILSETAEEAASGGSTENLPNIIVIMDETFSDLPSLYGFETDNELLPFISQLEENTIKGDLLVSVIGGGTANTEYEFITGNSLYTLPTSCFPYVQYMSKQQQSLASSLKSLGYPTIAYHPYYGNGYRRSANYPLLGFDTFYDIDADLPYSGYLRTYLSDSSDFANVISLYEQRDTSSPFFIFNVTMQNHGGYSASESSVAVTVNPTDEAMQLAPLQEYLSVVHETDTAFSELVEYFSNVEEDTIILLFGDHQPGLGEEANDLIADTDTGRYGADTKWYSSFVMWANFDIDEAEGVVTSPNYLRALLLDQAGVQLNAYEQFLLDLHEEYPAMNADGYFDADMVWHGRGEEDEPQALTDYRCVVYNNVFDKRHMVTAYYQHE
jgi:phosphoglycerol transferase MdoB-like AlkP superfamily enzyme